MTVEVTSNMLYAIAGHHISNATEHAIQLKDIHVLPMHMNIWFGVYGINKTKLRVAHFLAQACCETQDFVYLEENTSGKKYEPNTLAGRNVGNTQPGDGPKFIGRGLLHLTGRENYQKYGDKMQKDIVNHPKKVATDFSIAVQTACIFWSSHHLNNRADNDDFNGIFYLINGGTKNGRDARLRALNKAKSVLGIS